jgi:hypothetical protein
MEKRQSNQDKRHEKAKFALRASVPSLLMSLSGLFPVAFHADITVFATAICSGHPMATACRRTSIMARTADPVAAFKHNISLDPNNAFFWRRTRRNFLCHNRRLIRHHHIPLRRRRFHDHFPARRRRIYVDCATRGDQQHRAHADGNAFLTNSLQHNCSFQSSF